MIRKVGSDFSSECNEIPHARGIMALMAQSPDDDILARYFDAPIDSWEHRSLAEDCWLVGPSVSTRYYLGRILKRNLFRVSDAILIPMVREFIAKQTSKEGVALLDDLEFLSVADLLLCHHYERQMFGRSKRNKKLVAAVQAFLANPTMSDEELARTARTTEKQLARMSLLLLCLRARKL